MAHNYAMYNNGLAPQAITDRHQLAAEYLVNGTLFYLFCETSHEVLGSEASVIIDLSTTCETDAEFDTEIDRLAAETPSSREIQISKQQADYFFDSRFKIEE
jgi:cytidylate kinase